MAMVGHPRRSQNVEGLFHHHYYPWFFGEISREDAIQILNEAEKNDGESWASWGKSMLFLETVLDDIGQNRFAIIQGTITKDPHDNQPIIHFTEISHQGHWFSHWFPGTYVVRKKKLFLRSIGGGQSIDLWVQSGDSTVTKKDQRRNQKILKSQ